MRDIKFRAWREKQKFMLQPHSLIELFTYGELVNPDEVIWMQYTGLKDKNGVEIYEGDVVSVSYGSGEIIINEKVEYMVNKFELTWSCGNGFYGRSSSLRASNLLEVIGNIHQNPELLEDKK